MEIGRGGRLAAALLAAALAPAALAACPLMPGEHNLDYRIVDDGRAVELHRRSVAQGESRLCRLRLACRVAGAPSNAAYVLREGSIVLGDIIALRFYFADGRRQDCPVVGP